VAAKPRRFHGSVALRSERLSLEFDRVVQEVIAHLGDASAKIEVTIEISASAPEGFDEPVIRTVTENARTLHFTNQASKRSNPGGRGWRASFPSSAPVTVRARIAFRTALLFPLAIGGSELVAVVTRSE